MLAFMKCVGRKHNQAPPKVDRPGAKRRRDPGILRMSMARTLRRTDSRVSFSGRRTTAIELSELRRKPKVSHPGLGNPGFSNPACPKSPLVMEPTPPDPDHFCVDGEELLLGPPEKLTVLHTPGHTPGSVCFHADSQSTLYSGDTLFRMGIGRTDLWGGNHPQIITSIRERLLTLPGDTQVVPGHGPSTTIGAELKSNPFLQH